MFRKLNVLHGWLGIAGGLMVVTWYLTGLGIHWRLLPSLLSPEERQRTLGDAFAVTDAGKSFPDVLASVTEPVREVRLRRAGSRLVYELRTTADRVALLDAHTGEPALPLTESGAVDVAQRFLPETRVAAVTFLHEPDAYTAGGEYRITFDDFGKTRVYVDPTTASVSARARLGEQLNRLLAGKPHTFNFNGAFFRRHPWIIDGVLLVLNTLMLLIVASGIVLAVWRMIRNGLLGGGLRYLFVRKWHYLLGLVFSATTLGFVVSAFFFIFTDSSVPQARIAPRPADVRRVVRPLDRPRIRPLTAESAGSVSLVTLKQVLDVPIYVLQDPDGRLDVVRADTGDPFVVDDGWLVRVASAFLETETSISDVRYMEDYDSYYYARNKRFPHLPAYRVTANNDDGTLLYMSAATGEVTGNANREFRLWRWFVTGPHTWDWPFLLRRPALWSTVSVTLAIGGLAVTVSGLYLGWQMLLGTRRNRRYMRVYQQQQRRAS